MSAFICNVGRSHQALALAIIAAFAATPAVAQQMDHSTMDHSKMHHPPAATEPAPTKPKPKPKKKAPPAPAAKPADPQAGHTMPMPADPHAGHTMPMPADRHAGHAMPKPASRPPAADPHAGHTMPSPAQKPKAKSVVKRKPAPQPVNPHAGHVMPPPRTHPSEPVDHSTMDHSTMDHSTMDHSTMDHDSPAPTDQPRTPIPVLTPADRIAAFPEVSGHAAHDRSRHSLWLFDRFEASERGDNIALDWKASGWIGGDINRLWLRSEGESADGRVERGDLEVLGGHAISPWWDLVAGVRHDFGKGPSQTFAAVGVTGLAPYKIEVEATAYLGTSGQTAARIETSYDTLLTNRLILQWHAEADLYGRDDERRGIGSGLATLDGGVRLRYEITRQVAPYIGLTWERAFGGTADFRRDHLEDVSDTRLVAGVRVWF